MRVHVVPREDLQTPLPVFRADLDLDSERWRVVHLRGELVAVERP